jgi:hypothetical protein
VVVAGRVIIDAAAGGLDQEREVEASVRGRSRRRVEFDEK